MMTKNLPSWTTKMDREILVLMSNRMVLTPAVIARNIGRSRESVHRRLSPLVAGGLVTKVDRGHYQISPSTLTENLQ